MDTWDAPVSLASLSQLSVIGFSKPTEHWRSPETGSLSKPRAVSLHSSRSGPAEVPIHVLPTLHHENCQFTGMLEYMTVDICIPFTHTSPLLQSAHYAAPDLSFPDTHFQK